jgi:hypothetical protein
VHIELVAMAQRAHRQGLAAELATVIRDEIIDRFTQLDREHLIVTASVHPENVECRPSVRVPSSRSRRRPARATTSGVRSTTCCSTDSGNDVREEDPNASAGGGRRLCLDRHLAQERLPGERPQLEADHALLGESGMRLGRAALRFSKTGRRLGQDVLLVLDDLEREV